MRKSRSGSEIEPQHTYRPTNAKHTKQKGQNCWIIRRQHVWIPFWCRIRGIGGRGVHILLGHLLAFPLLHQQPLRLLVKTGIPFPCFHSLCVFRPNSLKIGTASVKQTQEACLNTWKKSFMIGSLLFTARMSSSLIHCSADSSLTTHYSGTPHPYGPSGTLSGRIWYRYPKQCRQSRSPSSAPAASRRVGSSASSHGSTPARFS